MPPRSKSPSRTSTTQRADGDAARTSTGCGAAAISSNRRQFLLLAIGTRGDAQPLVIIGKRLMQDGHVVRIGVHRKHRESVEAQVTASPLPHALSPFPLPLRLPIPRAPSRGWHASHAPHSH
mmetsp:Transcript_51670/g.143078  ORF Transcript_51670/g.143078 Transcript_51670/m.143078 type:complete len:122 (-) Transcript_51670:481-846(-)|eukprot:5145407-Prymnesium_polylepis.2